MDWNEFYNTVEWFHILEFFEYNPLSVFQKSREKWRKQISKEICKTEKPIFCSS